MSLYTLLEVERNASSDDIKKSFRKKALVNHPDKGGNKEEFQKLQEAYSILSDPAKRAEYDRTGQLPQEGPPQMDMSEIFGSMFGGGNPFNMFGMPGMPGMPGLQSQQKPRGPHKLHDIGLSLADLYVGKTITLRFKREVLCRPCNGKGGATTQCGACGGRGMQIRQQQMGPMITMTHVPCSSCQQTGSIVTQACNECKGKRLTEEETVLECHVKPGMKDGDRIVFPGKCSQSPQFSEPGDVILVIREVADKIWIRDGDNLTHDIQISMAESLVGFERNITTHPSGKPMNITCSRVIRHTDTIQLEGWGMPVGERHGVLIIRCIVTPCELTEAQRTLIKEVFEPKPVIQQTDHSLD